MTLLLYTHSYNESLSLGECLCNNDCMQPTFCALCECVVFFIKTHHGKEHILAVSLISVAIGICVVVLVYLAVWVWRRNPNRCGSIVIFRRANGTGTGTAGIDTGTVSIQTTPGLSRSTVSPSAQDLSGHL